MKNKMSLVLVVVLVMSLSSCMGNEKYDDVKNNSVENKQVNVSKSVDEVDEKLIDEVVKPLLEIK